MSTPGATDSVRQRLAVAETAGMAAGWRPVCSIRCARPSWNTRSVPRVGFA